MERCRMCQNMSGLSTAEVEFRKKAGLSNESVDSSTKTVAQIIRSNVVTYYNLIFLIITILLIVVGSFRDLTFLPIIIANMLIGIIQELRSSLQNPWHDPDNSGNKRGADLSGSISNGSGIIPDSCQKARC